MDYPLPALPANQRDATNILIGESQQWRKTDAGRAIFLARYGARLARETGHLTHIYQTAMLLFEYYIDAELLSEAAAVLRDHHVLFVQNSGLTVLPREAYLLTKQIRLRHS
jgi:hypothetical protein